MTSGTTPDVMHNQSQLEDLKVVVARRLELAPTALYGRSLKLSEVIVRSPVATNSIDLMEAFAGAMAELELDEALELPAMTLDHTMDDVIDELRVQLATS